MQREIALPHTSAEMELSPVSSTNREKQHEEEDLGSIVSHRDLRKSANAHWSLTQKGEKRGSSLQCA